MTIISPAYNFNCNHITCSECGGLDNHHRKGFSKFVDLGVCSECGYSSQSRRHSKDCSKYKPLSRCPECGKKGRARHKEGCSKYKNIQPCSECNGRDGHHMKTCSKFKPI